MAAACIAGALSLPDAARVAALRSRVIAGHLAGHGAMLSVSLPASDTRARIAGQQPRLEIATINGPAATVVAGEPAAVQALHQALEADGVQARLIAVDYASHTAHVERIHDELTALLAPLTPAAPQIPMYSTTDQAWVTGAALTPGYWYRNLRHPVHLHESVTTLAGSGHRTFIEVSTHPVLTPAIDDTLASHPQPTTTIPTLRRGHDHPADFCRALARLHTRTTHPHTWHLPPIPPAPDQPLPAYPFQHHRYWLESDAAAPGTGAPGMPMTGHPLLGAVLQLPDTGGAVFSSRVTLSSQAWLADHAVAGTVLVPGAALAECAVRAGDECGTPTVRELVMETPLTVPPTGAVLLRVTVSGEDEAGTRTVAVHSRLESGEETWTRHVTGLLSAAEPPPAAVSSSPWPPPGAQPLPADGFYADQRAAGFEFGPLFRGLRAVWQRDGEVFAEVALPDDAADPTGPAGFLLHPALLDSALHAAAFLPGPDDQAVAPLLPFSWSGFTLHASGAAALRVHVRRTDGEHIAVTATDPAGGPVVSVGALSMRPADVGRIAAPSAEDMLFRVDWREIPVPPAAPGRVPGRLVDLAEPEAEPEPYAEAGMPGRARQLAGRALEEIQAQLSQGNEPPLVLLTRDARSDPAMAAVWGLVRVAQSEHPGQVVIVDLDGTPESITLLPGAAATGEPQVAVSGGACFVPRLARHDESPGDDSPELDPDGTVLISGGTGTLGGLVARHLVTRHGARHLLLCSRRGLDAPEAKELQADLTMLGARATIVACDVGDPAAAAGLIAGIPAAHPLTAVIHTAARLDDGVITSQDRGRIDTVFGPKVDGAWNLHRLTRDARLAAFVLFSSASGTLGNAGQASYAAGNGFLDGLARYRQDAGLPGLSLAWGLWREASELTGGLLSGASGHLKREVLAMSNEDGLRLLDVALRHAGQPGPPVLVPVRLSLPALREAGQVPAVLRDLVPPARPVAQAGAAEPADSFRSRLRRLAQGEQTAQIVSAVLAHAAATLGHSDPGQLDEKRAFKDLGFDSLAAVELRNRLGSLTGLRLPATLVFDYPTPGELAGHIRAELDLDGAGSRAAPGDQALAELRRFETAVDALLAEPGVRSAVVSRLQKLAARWHAAGPETDTDLSVAADDDILSLAEAELGSS
ncbi:MAG TPA: SDR family NAD(P)-dependent oxidoreductase [Streptosporangiaceae bacterium]